ncbi:MAG: multi-sensor signal transduction histidine [Geobacteraceae bacterium]|nr:MAG: multi-sensor signal transduction histidine [Geobacteraceae bacterium]
MSRILRPVSGNGGGGAARRPAKNEMGVRSHRKFRSPSWKMGGVICVVRDITARKEVEEEIRKLNEDLERHALELSVANKELEAFSYSVSHDLRTPLTRIYSAGQALQEEYAACLDETGRFFVRTICEASEHMEELIDALMVLSRVTSKEMRDEEVDLSGLAREIAAELQLTQTDRQVEFVLNPGIKANGDEQLLRVALENLLENAWKYTRQVPIARIEFGVIEHHGRKVYFVRDNGAGFDMRDADKLFIPFQRLHHSKDFPGTGVGLATVQRIIYRHCGRVWGEGEVCKGATFYFTLK